MRLVFHQYSDGNWINAKDSALKFKGKLTDPKDTTFKYHVNRVYGIGGANGGETQVITEFRGNFEQQISGVTAFDAGLKMTATPTTVDGRSATKMSFTSSNANVVLLGDKSTAQWVVASARCQC